MSDLKLVKISAGIYDLQYGPWLVGEINRVPRHKKWSVTVYGVFWDSQNRSTTFGGFTCIWVDTLTKGHLLANAAAARWGLTT